MLPIGQRKCAHAPLLQVPRRHQPVLHALLDLTPTLQVHEWCFMIIHGVSDKKSSLAQNELGFNRVAALNVHIDATIDRR